MKGKQAGFTLTEILIAATIMVVAVGMGLNFSVESLRGIMYAENKSVINSSIRRINSELIDNAKTSTYFRLYNSFSNGDRDSVADVLYEGNAGNFLVLVSTGVPDPNNDFIRPIERIKGYFLDTSTVGTEGASPIRKFDMEISPASTAALETLLPDESTASSYEEVAGAVFGLANSKVFYNFWGKSVTVNAKVLHGNSAEHSTITYNITISPRG